MVTDINRLHTVPDGFHVVLSRPSFPDDIIFHLLWSANINSIHRILAELQEVRSQTGSRCAGCIV